VWWTDILWQQCVALCGKKVMLLECHGGWALVKMKDDIMQLRILCRWHKLTFWSAPGRPGCQGLVYHSHPCTKSTPPWHRKTLCNYKKPSHNISLSSVGKGEECECIINQQRSHIFFRFDILCCALWPFNIKHNMAVVCSISRNLFWISREGVCTIETCY